MSRPRGYIYDWEPRQATKVVLGAVLRVLEEYHSYGPMTVRQVFYRLVGEYGYDKTELAYKRLAEYLVKARRAGLIRFDAIRDDGTVEKKPNGWDDEAAFWSGVRIAADKFELDRQQGQPQRIELWCEAGGMAPMLASMVASWHVPVYSTGGFSSVTVTKGIADRVGGREQRTVFLHVGDFDPSGESIFESMTEDVQAFLDGDGLPDGHFEPVRVALTERQVATYNLPTAPPKASDTRSRSWVGETTQAEALPPDLLRQIIVAAVEAYTDEVTLEEILEQEAHDRSEIDRVLQIAEGSE